MERYSGALSWAWIGTALLIASSMVRIIKRRLFIIVTVLPNAKLTDDEDRASDARIGTAANPRFSSFGPATGVHLTWA